MRRESRPGERLATPTASQNDSAAGFGTLTGDLYDLVRWVSQVDRAYRVRLRAAARTESPFRPPATARPVDQGS